MTFYIAGPVTTDPSVLKQRAVAFMQAYMPPGWALQPGSMVDLMISAWSMVAAEQADVANTLLDSAFRYFGGLVGVNPIDASSATSVATFTVQDTAGYVIPAGTAVGVNDPTGVLQGFDLLAPVTVPLGSSTATGTVQAETAGVAANNLSGAAQLVQAPAFVTGVSLALSSQGVDAELDSDYLSRLAETLTLLTPDPVLPYDFAVLARSIPGVYRATSVDLLKPGPPYDVAAEATGQSKNVTVAVADINGNTVGTTVRGNVQAFLQAEREQNFKVWVVDPQYTSIDVAGTVYAWPSWDPVDVRTRVMAALTSILSPGVWATDPSGNTARWQNSPIIHLSDLYNAITSLPGVRYVEPLTFGIRGTAQVNAPAAPAPTNAATGGTVTAGTYGVVTTYVNAYGETVGSTAGTTTTTGATSTITVPSPAASGNATGWYAYVTQPGGSIYYRQQPAGSPSAIGTALPITAPPTVTGAQPPAANTTETLGTADVTLGAGSAIPALPTVGTLAITAVATT